jgi:hypothetical protein
MAMGTVVGNSSKKNHAIMEMYRYSSWSIDEYLIWKFPKMVVPPNHPK